MITSITIENFKNIRRQQIDLEPLTVFVGANGSGKTSVLEAINVAVRTATGSPEKVPPYRPNCDWLYTRGGHGDLKITFATEHGQFWVTASPPIAFPPPIELLGKSQWAFAVRCSTDLRLEDAVALAKSTVFLGLSASKLAKPSYSALNPPTLAYNGGGLASVLAHMALNAPDVFDELVSRLRELVPQLKRIRFKKAAVKLPEKELVRFGEETMRRRFSRTYQGEELLFDFENGSNILAQTASEGTLVLLGLLTVVLRPERPDVLLLDDLEHGLHPLAQQSLLEMLRKLMQTFPRLQIVATTHSPYLLNYLSPQQVRIMAIGPDGYTRCGRLTDHPKFSTWKDEMAPGEMWSLFGEKWLAEKGAAE